MFMLVAFSCSSVQSDENTEHLKSLNVHLRHVGSLDVLPIDDLGTIKHDYKCKSEDVAEISISNTADRDTKIDTCRKACAQDVGCQAWTLDTRQDHCWLKHSCNGGSRDYGFISGFVNHAPLLQHVTAPTSVAPSQLVGVMADTNCWGYDIAEVAIASSSVGKPPRDAFTVACKEACLINDACCAWTVNMGKGGTQGNGHCWLKRSCAGVSFDVQASSGLADCKNEKSNSATVTPAVPGIAKKDIPLFAGVASAAAGAGGIAIGLLAGLLAPHRNLTGIHNMLPSTTIMKPIPGSTTPSETVKPSEGPTSGALLWWLPLVLLGGCLMGLLATRWYPLAMGCCGRGLECDELEEENTGETNEETNSSTKRELQVAVPKRGGAWFAVPQGLMQVPLVPVVAVASPSQEPGPSGDAMPAGARTMTRGSSEMFAFVAPTPTSHQPCSPGGSLRKARSPPGSPPPSARGTLRSPRGSLGGKAPGCQAAAPRSPPGSPLPSARGTLRSPRSSLGGKGSGCQGLLPGSPPGSPPMSARSSYRNLDNSLGITASGYQSLVPPHPGIFEDNGYGFHGMNSPHL